MVLALSAMELWLGDSGFCRPTTKKQTKCIHNLCGVSRVFIFTLRLQYVHTWWIMVILIARRIRVLPIGAPFQDEDGAGSGISGLYCVSQKKLASANGVLSYKFCFEEGSYNQIIINATIFSCHLPKTWVHLMR